MLSSVIGVAVAKLFLYSDHFHSIQYVGGALACAAATSLMALTKTVHPPAGATALLAVVDDRLLSLGWFLVPVMLLGCTLMISVALVINNIERRFPMYWWTPEDLRKKPILHREEEVDLESQKPAAAVAAPEKQKQTDSDPPAQNGADPAPTETGQSPQTTAEVSHRKHEHNEVVIRPGDVVVPHNMYLTQEEIQLLEVLSRRL